jgi:nucleoid-associated protein YgaU
MTQENKFAIVIGFALLLVVGILVSDHLAELARGEPGSLVVTDPLEPTVGTVHFQPLISPSRTSPATPPVTSVPATAGMAIIMHTVVVGETLSQVAIRQYGDRSLATFLGTYNKLPNPDRLVVGQRLLIPDRAVLAAAAIAPEYASPVVLATVSPSNMAEYLVAPGDTLSELAQKLMGSARHTNDLLKLNKDRVRSADALRVGTRLRYPTAGLHTSQ